DWRSLFEGTAKLAAKHAWEADGTRKATLRLWAWHSNIRVSSIIITIHFSTEMRNCLNDAARMMSSKRRLCRRQRVVLLDVPYHVPYRRLQVYLASLLDREGLGVICARTPINISELEPWRRKDCEDLRAV